MQKEKPLITIVTLTYKKFDYIYDTIDSVLNQTYNSIEYIISDDGSPNFPKESIINYIEKNKKDNLKSFKVMTKPKNEGTVKNINGAYKSANGEILFPLSGDDSFYSDEIVEKIVSKFMNNKLDVLVTSRCFVNDMNETIKYSPSKSEIRKIMKLETNIDQHKAFITDSFFNMASGSALYIRKSFLKKWGYFDESYVLWEDGPFFTKYTINNKINFDYSIISIKYHVGGVSNSGENPLMRLDRIHYNNTDRINCIEKHNFFVKRQVNYICKRYEISDEFQKTFLYIRFLDVICFKIIKKILYKIY